ncbi:MAG TPA: methylenetetrahydrofolate reductase [Spirochaetota bacterium]|nr:methylenetetrahydrofolate reductase [Spirochaetota bacterium]HPN81826.1 methylenetetrahydrofolate reductase [Spirochaetota bacterium]
MQRIRDILASGTRTLSYEFFTPKTAEGRETLLQNARTLVAEARPDFISVTYGAGGTTREHTTALVVRLQHDLGIPVMHHLTCIGHSRDELRAIVSDLRMQGVDNILALRGDPPRGTDTWKAHPDGFHYAWELVRMIHEVAPECSIAGAAFPENHPESQDPELDAEYLRQKVEQGASFLITQLFFEVELYKNYLDRLGRHAVSVPVLPGILPVTNYQNLVNFTAGCKASIPDFVHKRFAPLASDDEATRQAGIDLAVEQCGHLMNAGSPGLHFYTLNRVEPVLSIVRKLGLH